MLTRPPWVSEAAGQEAIDLAESVGLLLDPWQKLIVRVALAEGADGLYAAREVGYLVARQNGKGAALEAITLHGMFLVGDPLTLWTAHQFKTSSEAFLRVRGWIDGSDDLRRRVKRIVAAHGEEGIELTSGPRLRFLARSKSSGRGFSPQRIIFDEAQELAKVAAEAMLPSMRAQRNRQAIYTGTVPGPDINNPDHWTRLRDRGREGVGRLAWLEWTPKGSDRPDTAERIDLDDRRAWAAANPSLGVDRATALALDSVAADREGLSEDSFARECLSIWPTLPEDGVAIFGAGKWEACHVDTEPPAVTAVGVAVALDRSWGSIAAAGVNGEVIHVGSVKRDPGTGWLVDEVARIQREHGCTVAVNGKGPASDLVTDLRAAGVSVLEVDTDGYIAACAGFYDRVQTRTLSHSHTTDLDDAVKAAGWRAIGERRAFGHKASTGDISMLEAATVALWAASNDLYDPALNIH